MARRNERSARSAARLFAGEAAGREDGRREGGARSRGGRTARRGEKWRGARGR